MQYVALQMMIAELFWLEGRQSSFIWPITYTSMTNQFEQAEELLRREPSDCQP